MKVPAFQFYPSDFLASQRVQMLTLEEEGAYIRLLCYCWLHGSIPADPERCSRLVGKGTSSAVAKAAQALFIEDPSDASKLIHDRLEKERAKQVAWREKSSEGGKKSGKSRRKAHSNHRSTTVEPPLKARVEERRLKTEDGDERVDGENGGVGETPFEQFWKAYPRKVGKGYALKTWKKLKCDSKLPEILVGVRLAKASDSWTKDGGQFIPYPQKWLNSEGWLDDPSTWPISNGRLSDENLHTQKSKYGF